MRLGLIIAALVIALDQTSKAWLLALVGMESAPAVAVTPFFNLVMVWNKGVSFGMLSGHDQPLPLILLALGICMVLLYWLKSAEDSLLQSAIGAVIGGALGNVIDRLRFGAVADFFDFHLAGYHWPAFNVADACIFLGVVVLCVDSFRHRHKE